MAVLAPLLAAGRFLAAGGAWVAGRLSGRSLAILGAVAAVVAIAGLSYCSGYAKGRDSHGATIARLTVERDVARSELAALEAVMAAAARDRDALAAEIRRLSALPAQLAAPANICFAGPDADVLRSVFLPLQRPR